MFKKLFGSSNASDKKKAAEAPKVDPMQAMDKLQDEIRKAELRTGKIEADMKNLVKEALEKKKAKDQRGKDCCA